MFFELSARHRLYHSLQCVAAGHVNTQIHYRTGPHLIYQISVVSHPGVKGTFQCGWHTVMSASPCIHFCMHFACILMTEIFFFSKQRRATFRTKNSALLLYNVYTDPVSVLYLILPSLVMGGQHNGQITNTFAFHI